MRKMVCFSVCLVLVIAAASVAMASSLLAYDIDLGRYIEGYQQPTVPRDVNVTNTTNQTVVIQSARFETTLNAFTFTRGDFTIAAGSTAVVGEVLPRVGLSKGIHIDTLLFYDADGRQIGSVRVRLEVSDAVSLSVVSPIFADVWQNDEPQQAKSIVISNDGVYRQVILGVGIEGAGSAAFGLIEGIPGAIDKNGTNSTWSVAPVAGLSAGVYTAEIVVRTEHDGMNHTFSSPISFRVSDGVLADDVRTQTTEHAATQTAAQTGTVFVQVPVIVPVDTAGETQAQQNVLFIPAYDESDADATAGSAAPTRSDSDGDQVISGGGYGHVDTAGRPSLDAFERSDTTGISSYANIRSGPGTNTDVIGRIDNGQPIWLIKWNDNEEWCEVYYEGGARIGWLYWEFVAAMHH